MLPGFQGQSVLLYVHRPSGHHRHHVFNKQKENQFSELLCVEGSLKAGQRVEAQTIDQVC